MNADFEAVWFRNGKEVEWVDPVITVEIDGTSARHITVYNGSYYYHPGDGTISDDVDGFLVRQKQS